MLSPCNGPETIALEGRALNRRYAGTIGSSTTLTKMIRDTTASPIRFPLRVRILAWVGILVKCKSRRLLRLERIAAEVSQACRSGSVSHPPGLQQRIQILRMNRPNDRILAAQI